ncbi:MAG TPA: hypothetical protein VK633_07950, partial [Verrucomicrobiae bacterium]|nr:hypothetical protein [Verrucomicrobiae bacterium]
MSDDKVTQEPPQKTEMPSAFPNSGPASPVVTSVVPPPRKEPWPGPRHTIALIQGLYYLVAGLW